MKTFLLAFLLLFSASFVSAAQFTVQWKSMGPGATGYRLERAPAGPPGYVTWTVIATVGSSVKRYVDTGLADNTMYQYRVRAYNDTQVSPYSNIVTKVTPRA